MSNFRNGDRVLVNGKPARFHVITEGGWCVVKLDGVLVPTLWGQQYITPLPPAAPHLVRLYRDAKGWRCTEPVALELIETHTVDLRVTKLAEVGIVVWRNQQWNWVYENRIGTHSGCRPDALTATDAAWEYAVGRGLVT